MIQWRMDFDRETSAGYVVNLMARLFARHLEAGIRPLGLGTGVFPALLLLWEQDGVTQRDLVEGLQIEQPTMANTLARMERDGLIKRRRDQNDARVQRIWLTDKARALERTAKLEAARVNEQALAGLTEEERRAFLTLMAKVISALEEPPG